MSRETAIRLLNAQSEEEVQEIIEEIDGEWIPFGDTKNNMSSIEGGPEPVQAYTELITNSTDAILERHSLEQFGGPAPGVETYEAAEETILNQDDAEIEIIADGETRHPPNLTIRDNGVGVPAAEFTNAFFGLYEAGIRKRDWPFLQGQFGKGGTAVIPHSGGENGYGHKLVISASHLSQNEWCWSITKVNEDQAQYEYLMIDGDVPRFTGSLRGHDFGTFVKVYEYPCGADSHIPTQLRHQLRSALWYLPIELTLREGRDHNKASDVATFKGGHDMRHGYPNIIEDEWTRTADFGGKIGEREYHVVVAKPDTEVEDVYADARPKRLNVTGIKSTHLKQAVFFTVNGQTHATLRESFIRGNRRCGFKQAGIDTLVFMDFSDWRPREKRWVDLIRLFKPNRDDLMEKPLAQQLVDGLERALKDDPNLKRIDRERRQKSISETQDERSGQLLEEFIRSHPVSQRYLTSGQLVSFPGRDEQTEREFNPPPIPESFNIIRKQPRGGSYETWDKDERFVKRQAENREKYLWFELTAPDDYFTRDELTGDFFLEPDIPIANWGLNRGILQVTLTEPDEYVAGDSVDLTAIVTRPGMDALQEELTIEYGGSEPKSDTGGDSSTDERPEARFDLPEMKEVTEDQFEDRGWDETDILEIHENADGKKEFHINVDAAPYRTFLVEHGVTLHRQNLIKSMWKVGLTLYGLGMYIEAKEGIESNGHYDMEPEDIVSMQIKGVAPFMLDQHIDEDTLNYVTSGL